MSPHPDDRCAGCGQRHIEHSWRDGVFWCDGASCFTPITVRAESMPLPGAKPMPARKRNIWCRLGLHMWGLVRNWWEGHTIHSLYVCRDCGRFTTRRTRT